MAQNLINDLLEQFQRMLKILKEEIGRFDDNNWRTGINGYQIPAKLAIHTTDALDYYFREDLETPYRWGHRFTDGKWWELSGEQFPSQAEILTYCDDLEARIIRHLNSLDDSNLTEHWPKVDGSTRLGHYIYAIRHTTHHHGEIAALACFHGLEGGSWA